MGKDLKKFRVGTGIGNFNINEQEDGFYEVWFKGKSYKDKDVLKRVGKYPNFTDAVDFAGYYVDNPIAPKPDETGKVHNLFMPRGYYDTYVAGRRKSFMNKDEIKGIVEVGDKIVMREGIHILCCTDRYCEFIVTFVEWCQLDLDYHEISIMHSSEY